MRSLSVMNFLVPFCHRALDILLQANAKLLPVLFSNRGLSVGTSSHILGRINRINVVPW